METKKRKTSPPASAPRAVAGKLLKVRERTHRILKVASAERGQTIGELLDEFADTLKVR